MTDQELIAALDAVEQYLATHAELVRVVVAADGTVINRISRGYFEVPPDWEPPPSRYNGEAKGHVRGH